MAFSCRKVILVNDHDRLPNSRESLMNMTIASSFRRYWESQWRKSLENEIVRPEPSTRKPIASTVASGSWLTNRNGSLAATEVGEGPERFGRACEPGHSMDQ